jgi:hypothetical protein
VNWQLEGEVFLPVTIGTKAESYDPWDMRAEYQRLPEGDNEAALAFLNRYGLYFKADILSALALAEGRTAEEVQKLTDNFRYFRAPDGDHLIHAAILPLATEGFWLGRKAIVRRLDLKATRIEQLEYEARLTEAGQAQPTIVLTMSSINDALWASIQVDQLCKREFRKCARADCPGAVRFAAAPSDRRKKYCSWYCAHIETVRASRRKR